MVYFHSPTVPSHQPHECSTLLPYVDFFSLAPISSSPSSWAHEHDNVVVVDNISVFRWHRPTWSSVAPSFNTLFMYSFSLIRGAHFSFVQSPASGIFLLQQTRWLKQRKAKAIKAPAAQSMHTAQAHLAIRPTRINTNFITFQSNKLIEFAGPSESFTGNWYRSGHSCWCMSMLCGVYCFMGASIFIPIFVIVSIIATPTTIWYDKAKPKRISWNQRWERNLFFPNFSVASGNVDSLRGSLNCCITFTGRGNHMKWHE